MSETQDNSNIPENAGNLPENPPRRKRRILLYLLLFAGILLLLIAAGAVFAASAVFDPAREYPVAVLNAEDLRLQQQLINRVTRELFRRKPSKESTIVLSHAEVKSLLRLLDFGTSAAKVSGFYNGMELRYFELDFDGNDLQGVYPYDTGCGWFFGGVAHVSVAGKPDFDGERFRFKLRDCRVGAIQLPMPLAEKILAFQLEKLHQSRFYARFCELIKKVSIRENGSIAVTYNPAKLLPLLTYR